MTVTDRVWRMAATSTAQTRHSLLVLLAAAGYADRCGSERWFRAGDLHRLGLRAVLAESTIASYLRNEARDPDGLLVRNAGAFRLRTDMPGGDE